MFSRANSLFAYSLALLGVVGLTPVSALYEDEVGVSDWHLEQLGKLTDSPARGIYYSHYTGILAKLNETDGSIVWRKKLTEAPEDSGYTPQLHHISNNNLIVVGVSSQDVFYDIPKNCKLSAYDSLTSSQQWELTVSGECVGVADRTDLNVLTSSGLYTVDFVTGSVISTPLKPKDLNSPYRFYGLSSTGVILTDVEADTFLEYTLPKSVKISSDKEEEEEEEEDKDAAPIPDPFSNSPKFYGSGQFLDYKYGHFVWFDGETSKEKNVGVVRVGSSELYKVGEDIGRVQVISSSAIISQTGETLSVFTLSKGEVNFAYKIENVLQFSILTPYSYVILKTDNTIAVIDTKTGSSTFSRKALATPSYIIQNFVQYPNGIVEPVNYSTTNGTKTVSWSRDESLAHLAGLATIDYPYDTDLSLDFQEALYEESADFVTAYFTRTHRHIKDLIRFVRSVSFTPRSLINHFISFLKPRSEIDQQRDNVYFGLKKYFVAVSVTGRVQALDSSLKGKTVWARDVLPARHGLEYDLSVTNVDNKVYIVGKSTGDVIVIDGLTGETISTFTIPNIDGEEERIVKITDLYLPRELDGEPIVEEEVDPADEKVKVPIVWTSSDKLYKLDGSVFVPKADIYLSQVSGDKKTVLGYRVHGLSGRVESTWIHNAPSNHLIHTVTSRSPLDRTVNIGHVLGDRSVLYKYLHSNMIAVLSTAPGSVHVSLVDNVTGRILYSEIQETGLDSAFDSNGEYIDGSTHIVVGESWVVFTFWASQPTLGQIVVVWDLFESETPNVHWMTDDAKEALEEAPVESEATTEEETSEETDPDEIKPARKLKTAHSRRSFKSKKDSKNEKNEKAKKISFKSKPAPSDYSSFEYYDAPHVKSQAFFVPLQFSRVTSMGISRTRFGVTVRDVLISNSRGQVLSLPKRPSYLDARRPTDRDPTKDEQAEGVSRYNGLLGYDAKNQVISHSEYVLGVEHIDTVPTLLESTSVVVAYGLDIFSTRVTPSKQFDILAPSFGKDKLSFTIMGLVGVAMYLRPLVSKRQTDNIWK